MRVSCQRDMHRCQKRGRCKGGLQSSCQDDPDVAQDLMQRVSRKQVAASTLTGILHMATLLGLPQDEKLTAISHDTLSVSRLERHEKQGRSQMHVGSQSHANDRLA